MTQNMIETNDTKKGILILYQSALTVTEQHRCDRRMREVFARLEGKNGTVPSKGVYKIRNGEQHPWRVLLRRFAEARHAGTSIDDVLAVLRELEAAVKEELYARRDVA